MPDKVEIFIDGSNFFNGLLKQFGDGRYDIQNLVNRVLEGRLLGCVNFYIGTLDPGREASKSQRQKEFLYNLERFSYIKIFTRPLHYYKGWPTIPAQEKGIDARMVQDLIVGAFDSRYDVAVILSGDQDFCEVVDLIHRRFQTVKLETYYPASRRHLYESTRHCFNKSAVIDKKFHKAIAIPTPPPPLISPDTGAESSASTPLTDS